MPSAQVLLSTSSQAKYAKSTLNGAVFHGREVVLDYPTQDTLLFVGNLPLDFTDEQFYKLMCKFGVIERLCILRSEKSGLSKGYGIVEYFSQECCEIAKKQLMMPGSNHKINGRPIQVDTFSVSSDSYSELLSRTLFVEHLPKYLDNQELWKISKQAGSVTFCQVNNEENEL